MAELYLERLIALGAFVGTYLGLALGRLTILVGWLFLVLLPV